jgi:hypothetical protein
MAHQPEPEKEDETMDTQTIPRPTRRDKIFRLHTPSWTTTPPTCLSCGAPVGTLAQWFATECSTARQLEGAV